MAEQEALTVVRGKAPCPCGRDVVIEGPASGGEEFPFTCECGLPWLLRCSQVFDRNGRRSMNLEMRRAPDDGGEIIVLARSIRHDLDEPPA